MQADVTGFQGQLQNVLAECKSTLHNKEIAHADLHKEISNLNGHLVIAADADSAQSGAKSASAAVAGGCKNSR